MGYREVGGREVSIRAPPLFFICSLKCIEMSSVFKWQSVLFTRIMSFEPCTRSGSWVRQGLSSWLSTEESEIQRDYAAGPTCWSLLARPWPLGTTNVVWSQSCSWVNYKQALFSGCSKWTPLNLARTLHAVTLPGGGGSGLVGPSHGLHASRSKCKVLLYIWCEIPIRVNKKPTKDG